MSEASEPSSRSIQRRIAYEPVCDLASGGMAQVQLVLRRDARFRRLYALKRPHSNLLEEPSVRDMFFEEARLVGLIRHPNVVPLLDVGEDEDGPFLLMDYVDGVPLSQLLSTARKQELLLPLQIPLAIGRQIALGLHAAHELKDADGTPLFLVHRDVSPSNILVGYDGVVCVTDFGIAKAIRRSVDTTAGLMKGKLAYMSPEQVRLQPLDRRSDLFSLGVVLYEMFAGKRLYFENLPENSARRILESPPPDLAEARSDVPTELVELLFDLLSKDHEDRPSTAKEVGDRLGALLHEARKVEEPVELAEFLRDEISGPWTEKRARVEERVRRVEKRLSESSGSSRPTTASVPKRSWLAALTLVVGVAALVWAAPSLLRLLPGDRTTDVTSTELSAAAAEVPVAPPELGFLTVDAQPPCRVRAGDRVLGTSPINSVPFRSGGLCGWVRRRAWRTRACRRRQSGFLRNHHGIIAAFAALGTVECASPSFKSRSNAPPTTGYVVRSTTGCVVRELGNGRTAFPPRFRSSLRVARYQR